MPEFKFKEPKPNPWGKSENIGGNFAEGSYAEPGSEADYLIKPVAANEPNITNRDVVGRGAEIKPVVLNEGLMNEMAAGMELQDHVYFQDTTPDGLLQAEETFNKMTASSREENLARVITPQGGASGAGGEIPGNIADARVLPNTDNQTPVVGKGTGYSMDAIKAEQAKKQAENTIGKRLGRFFGLN